MKYTAWFTTIFVLLTNTAIFADEKQATNPTTVPAIPALYKKLDFMRILSD